MRALPEVCEVHSGSFLWGGEIPWLPDLLAAGRHGSVTGRPIRDAFGRQVALIRALATSAPLSSSVQLRFVVEGNDPERRVRMYLLGRADQLADARRLARLTLALLPTELPFEPAPLATLKGILDPVEGIGPDQWAEVRRAVETLAPRVDDERDQDPQQPVVLPWNWSPHALLGSLGLLRDQVGTAVLGVHIEPHTVDVGVLDYLAASITECRELARDDESPLASAGIAAYRRWLRELPRAAVTLRVFLASEDPLAAGLAEAVGTDLTRGWEFDGLAGGFQVFRPQTLHEAESARLLLEELSIHDWGSNYGDPELGELVHLFDPYEANAAFRLPVTAEGGIAGVATGHMSTLGIGINRKRVDGEYVLGVDSGGSPVTVSRSEVNRHVLVAGLPGFGKTTTVHRLLWELSQGDDPVPFLVLDPAKTDYEYLAIPGVRTIELTPDHVGFNPLAVPAGATGRQYGPRVAAAFDSAFRQSERWPFGAMLLSQAIAQTYVRSGSETPTLNSLYAVTAELIENLGFSGEYSSNARALLLGRLASLSAGPLGKTLLGGPGAGIDWAEVLSTPTVIQLRKFSAPTERSLVFSLLLAGLISFREANPTSALSHVTVLEEAHRVLGSRPGEAVPDGTRAFAEAIAELRGSGEGFVVVEQAPSLLDPSVLKIVGSKVVHRTVDLSERQVLGGQCCWQNINWPTLVASRLGARSSTLPIPRPRRSCRYHLHLDGMYRRVPR